MSAAFWDAHHAKEAEIAEARAEALRVEKVDALRAKLGADAFGRLCCAHRHEHPDEICAPHECAVIEHVLG